MDNTVTNKKVKTQIIIDIILTGIIIFFGVYTVYLDYKLKNHVKEISSIYKTDGKYEEFYIEREFESLKKKNRELYDSLKDMKQHIKTLEEFTYSKKYSTGKIIPQKPIDVKSSTEEKESSVDISESDALLQDSTYSYSQKTDSLSYDLQINSKTEPNWYSLDVEIKDKFTIVNKDYGDGRQSISIESQNKGAIDNVIAWQKPTKKKWYQRFAVGPSVSVGYDVINKNFGAMVGASVVYNILGN